MTWSDLGPAVADDVIAAEIERFRSTGASWEWKHYSYDQPADLPDRLVAAGFERQPPETLMVAETRKVAGTTVVAATSQLPAGDLGPSGVQLRRVTDEAGVAAVVDLHNRVFGGDHARVGRVLAAALQQTPPRAAAVVAWGGGAPVSAGRLELGPDTDFAGLWGGGTLPAWRGRGIFRAVVAERAAIALERGYTYLQVDASSQSRPILERLGFRALATTTPYTFAAGAQR